MNNKPFELADKVLPNEFELLENSNPDDFGFLFEKDELAKYAELLVNECVDVLKQESERLEAFPDRKESAQAYSLATLLIRNHFGMR